MSSDPTRAGVHDPTQTEDELPRPNLRSSPAPRRGRAVARPAWQGRYVRSTVFFDTVAVTVACLVAVLFGPRVMEVGNGLSSVVIGPVVALLLLVSTAVAGASDPSVLGAGSAEYRRLVRAFAATAVGLGLVGLAVDLDELRGWIFVVIPAACLLAVVGRFLLRLDLYRRRAAGKCASHVLAVGTADAVADLILRTRRERHHGWVVTGACTPTGAGLDGTDAIFGVPVLGDLDAVAGETRRGRHHIVAVSVTPGWSPARLHRLAWDIQEVGVELVVDPRLTEVAGPRLEVELLDGLPMLRLTQPALGDASRLLKGLVDRLGAAVLLVLLAPLLLGLAVAIRSDGGPALVRQIRVSRGRRFNLLRFRSVATDPDRATPLGALIHRNGLDRLPQLFNVLGGSMSLVGPRPARPAEEATYPTEIRAASLVRPGLTGLWQSGGCTALSPEENVRLDLRYVRDWSLTQDAAIAWHSVKAATEPTRDD